MNIRKLLITTIPFLLLLSACDEEKKDLKKEELTKTRDIEVNEALDPREEIKRTFQKENPNSNIELSDVKNFNVDSFKQTLPGANLPKMSDDEKKQMWDHTIHKQMKGVLDIMCREYKKGTLDKNKKLVYSESGLKTLPVQFGGGKPVKDDSFVAIKYVAMTVDGVEYDHMFMKDRYFRFKMGNNEVVAGLEEGVKGMKEGGKAVFFIPAQLAYGDKGRVGVPPNAEVAYLVALDQVN